MSAAWLDWLGWNVLGALPLVLLALVLERLARRSPALVHLAWGLVLVRLVLPPVPGLQLPALFEPLARAAAAAWISLRGASSASTLFQDSLSGRSALLAGPLLQAAACLLCAWIALHAAREFWLHWSLMRALRQAPLAPDWLRGMVREEAQAQGLREPRLRLVRGLSGPCVCGLRQPTMLWPAEHLELCAGDRAVLAHELAHLARHENAWSLLAQCAHLLHGWNPLARRALRGLRESSELACDARALERHPGERGAYARALLAAAAGQWNGPRSCAPLCTAAGRSLEQRLERLFEARVAPQLTSSTVSAAACLLALMAFAPAAVPPLGVHPGSTDPQLRARARSAWGEAELAQALPSLGGEDARLLGLELALAGRQTAAIAAFERQFHAQHRTDLAAYNLACMHSLLGRIEQAAEWFARAVELEPVRAQLLDQDPDLAALAASPCALRLRALPR